MSNTVEPRASRGKRLMQTDDRLGLRIDARLKKAAEAAAEADDRSLTSLVQKIIKDELVRRGFWPPPDDKER